MKCLILFSRKNKNYSLSSAEFALSMVGVKCFNRMMGKNFSR